MTSKGKKRVLIIEDEMPLALLMLSALTHVGCDAHIATTGKKAMEKAAAIKFDLITLDIELPDINGFEICRELKQMHISRHTPIIFISASPCEPDRQESLKLGAVDYIEKPFHASNFVSRVLPHIQDVYSIGVSPFEEEFP